MVGVAGGGGDVEGVSWSGAWSGGPAGGFFGVVAGFAEPGAVVLGRGAVVVPLWCQGMMWSKCLIGASQ